CDGMGGHAGGRVASRVAVDVVLDAYAASAGEDIEAELRAAVEAANAAVWERSSREPALHGMGTTVVALALRGREAAIAHVGDSRCYLIRDGALRALTLDHSFVQQMRQDGLITEEEMETHPRRNVILRSLGLRPTVAIDTTRLEPRAGDVFLLA